MKLKKMMVAAATATMLGLGVFGSGIGVASADPNDWPVPGPGHGHNDGRGNQGWNNGRNNGWNPGRDNNGPGWQGDWNANHRFWAWQNWNNAPPWGWGPPPAAQWQGDWYPHPINYWGYDVNPYWNPDFLQWGFYLFGVWIPLVII